MRPPAFVRSLIFAVLVLACASVASPAWAQNATSTLVYDYDAALTAVNTYTQVVLLDGAAMPAPACVAKSATTTTCTTTIPTLSASNHTIVISATLGGQTATTTFTGLNPNNSPKNASNVRVTVTVTVNAP